MENCNSVQLHLLLNDREFGDEIQQLDSRLQQGMNVQYVHPYAFGNARALLTLGGNLHAFQANVSLYPSADRTRTEQVWLALIQVTVRSRILPPKQAYQII